MTFEQAAVSSFAFLPAEFGYTGPIDIREPSQIVEFRYVGPVAVQVLYDRFDAAASVNILTLQSGAFPSTPPIASIPVELLMRVSQPNEAGSYDAIVRAMHDEPSSIPYVERAAADLRRYHAALLRGDLSVIEIVRATLADVPGVPGVDWWASNQRRP